MTYSSIEITETNLWRDINGQILTESKTVKTPFETGQTKEDYKTDPQILTGWDIALEKLTKPSYAHTLLFRSDNPFRNALLPESLHDFEIVLIDYDSDNFPMLKIDNHQTPNIHWLKTQITDMQTEWENHFNAMIIDNVQTPYIDVLLEFALNVLKPDGEIVFECPDNGVVAQNIETANKYTSNFVTNTTVEQIINTLDTTRAHDDSTWKTAQMWTYDEYMSRECWEEYIENMRKNAFSHLKEQLECGQLTAPKHHQICANIIKREIELKASYNDEISPLMPLRRNIYLHATKQ